MKTIKELRLEDKVAGQLVSFAFKVAEIIEAGYDVDNGDMQDMAEALAMQIVSEVRNA